MPTFSTWVRAAEAARLLQPFTPSLDAAMLLTDWRRRTPKYRQRISRPPYWEKRAGRVVYPLVEVQRIAAELRSVAHAAPHAPVIAKAPHLPSGDDVPLGRA